MTIWSWRSSQSLPPNSWPLSAFAKHLHCICDPPSPGSRHSPKTLPPSHQSPARMVFPHLWLYNNSTSGYTFQQRYNAFSCPGYITPPITNNGTPVVSAALSTASTSAKTKVVRPDFSISPFAYVFYATERDYACSVLVNIDRLNNLFNTTHRIIVLVKPDLQSEYLKTFTAQNATVIPYEPPPLANNEIPYYRNVLLKLVAFRLHHYIPSFKRILILDSDQLILQSLDHVFDLPSVDVAAPRAYWQKGTGVTSAFLLVCLSDRVWDKISQGLQTIGPDVFDMDFINNLFQKTFLILPGDYATLNSHWETNGLPDWWQDEKPKLSDDFFQPPLLSNPSNESPPLPDPPSEPSPPRLSPLVEQDPSPPSDLLSDPSPSSALSPPIEPNLPLSPDSLSDPTVLSPLTELNPSPPPLDSLSDPSPVPSLPVEPTPSPLPSQPPYPKNNSTGITNQTFDHVDHQSLSARALPDIGTQQKKAFYYDALYKIYADVKILHFTALGKPWSWPANIIDDQKPLAHELFKEQFRTWQDAAEKLCYPLQKKEYFWKITYE